MGCGCINNFCYYRPFYEEGEIFSNEIIKTLTLNFSKNNNNSEHLNYENIINNEDEQSQNNNFFLSNIDEKINNLYDLNNESNLVNYSQLNSIILENVDKLCPEKKKCIICLENFEKNDKIINLSCLHMFHDYCIKKWVKEYNYCPICKNPI